MKKIFLIVIVAFLMSFKVDYKVTTVSWYGPGFDGRKTASGEIFFQDSLTCASPRLPFGTLIKVVNLNNGKSVIVKVNDRGPYKMDSLGRALRPLIPHPKRRFDLSKAAFDSIGNLNKGLLKVKYKILTR